MAEAEGGEEEEEEEEDEEEQGGEQEEFIVPDEEGEPAPSPSYYRRLQREEVSPYFPSAFAVDASSPLEFNFDLFLLDSLSLPCAIEKRGETNPPAGIVNFETPASAMAYCKEKIEQGWRATLPPTPSQLPATASKELDKRALFLRDGRSLAKALKSGQRAFDASLKEVRLDRLALIKVTVLMNRLGNFSSTRIISFPHLQHATLFSKRLVCAQPKSLASTH